MYSADVRLIPFVFIATLILCLLLIAFTFNFLPVNQIPRPYLDPHLRYDINFERLNDKIIVTGRTTIELNEDDMFIEMKENKENKENKEKIYTLTLKNSDKCKNLTVYNNSNYLLNLMLKSNLKSKFVTLLPRSEFKIINN